MDWESPTVRRLVPLLPIGIMILFFGIPVALSSYNEWRVSNAPIVTVRGIVTSAQEQPSDYIVYTLVCAKDNSSVIWVFASDYRATYFELGQQYDFRFRNWTYRYTTIKITSSTGSVRTERLPVYGLVSVSPYVH